MLQETIYDGLGSRFHAVVTVTMYQHGTRIAQEGYVSLPLPARGLSAYDAQHGTPTKGNNAIVPVRRINGRWFMAHNHEVTVDTLSASLQASKTAKQVFNTANDVFPIDNDPFGDPRTSEEIQDDIDLATGKKVPGNPFSHDGLPDCQCASCYLARKGR